MHLHDDASKPPIAHAARRSHCGRAHLPQALRPCAAAASPVVWEVEEEGGKVKGGGLITGAGDSGRR